MALGLAGLTLSGAPSLAVMLGAGASLIHLMDHGEDEDASAAQALPAGVATACLLLSTVAVALLASVLDLWRWRIEMPAGSLAHWRGLARLLLWFCWPAWPLALWTVWRWRWQVRQMLLGRISRHLALPLLFAQAARTKSPELFLAASLLVVRGTLQNQHGVTHVVARSLHDQIGRAHV